MINEGQYRSRAGWGTVWGLLLAAGLLYCSSGFSASHRGKDFWICFPAGIFEPYVLITAELDAAVTIDIPGLQWSDSFAVAAGQGVKRAIPPEAQVDFLTNDGVESKGVHIRATTDIALYGYSGSPYTEAGFLALPDTGLGYEYIAACYTDAGPYTPPGHFVVLAAENDTTVTVVPSDDYGARAAGVVYTVSLDQGQIYRLGGMQSGTTYDLTGSRICSDKPVAVYIGAEGGFIPGNVCCSDAILEQAPPLTDLGTDYLLVPYINRDAGDFVRIVAVHEGTEVAINGSLAAVLGEGDFHQVNLIIPMHVTSNRPVMVVQFMKSEEVDNMWGDPEMMVVTPTANFLSGYLAMADDSLGWNNYSNIVVPTGAIGSLAVDGTPVNPADFAPIGSSGYSYGRLPIEIAGARSFSCSSPFGVYIYGKHLYGSYTFPAGMDLTGCASFGASISPPDVRAFVGQQACFDLKVTDAGGIPVAGQEIEILIQGANPSRYVLYSDANGVARHCYAARQSGRDEIAVAPKCGCGTGAYDQASVIWTDLGTLRVFPNPFDRKRAVRGTVKFEGLQIGSQVRVYTTRGLKVWEGTVDKPYIVEWNGSNEGGDQVAPGTYLWVAESKGSKWDGILVVK